MRRHSTSNSPDGARSRTHPSSLIPHPSESGVALILTLAILALVTLLLIAFVSSMRVENAASKNFNELIKARELAQAGVDEAVGAIRIAAPIIALTNGGSNYVTAPGMIYTWASGAWTPHQLFTSVNGNDPNPFQAKTVNLNTNFVITGSGTVFNASTYANSQILVGWSNITVATTVNGISQPVLVGRYAYWVDDESTKVNLNVAEARANDPSGLLPDAVDLPTLFQTAEAGNLTNYTQNTRPLDTIQEAMMVSPPLVGNAPSVSGFTFSNTQFYVTAHSTSPDFTPWGTKRVNLSSVVSNAASKAAAVSAIVSNLTDPNLDAWIGQDFSEKYPNVQQIAANIVDYITTDNTPADPGSYNDTTPPSYLGLKETPYLNEVVISNAFQMSNLGSGTYALSVNSYAFFELWYMYGNSTGWTPPKNPAVVILNNGGPLGNGASLTVSIGNGLHPVPIPLANTYTINSGFQNMGPGSYQVVPLATPAPVPMLSQTFSFTSASPPAAIPVTLNPGTITAIFTSQQLGNKGRMDYAVIGFPTRINLNVPVPASGSTLSSALWASQCNDPRVKPISNTWIQNLKAPTLGVQNSAPPLNLSAGSGNLAGDGDMSCHTNNSANWPNSGTTGRQRGTMYPSELAYIHTGVPWRTFWLEPQPSAEGNVVPDWLAVDLFSATDITNVSGRININTQMSNVSGIGGSTPPQRDLPPNSPLNALLVSGGNVATIYNPELDGPVLPSMFAPSASAFTTAGEVCQATGLADGGGLKSAREAQAQEILNIITTRSNTFTIWCLAQSVRKVDKTLANLPYFTPGIDVITGETKVQAIVERTVDTSSGTPQVKFRTLYYRYYYQ